MLRKIIRKIHSIRRRSAFHRGYKQAAKERFLELAANSIFDNTSRNKRCFILGNGPSIKDLDFSLFRDEDVFTMNQISRNLNFDELKVKYHFLADPLYFAEDTFHNSQIGSDLLDCLIRVFELNPKAKFFVSCPLNNGVVRELQKHGEVFSYVSFGSLGDYPDSDSLSLTKPAPGFYSVIQYAIFAALCMGYKELFLFGSEETSLLTILNTKLTDVAHTDNYGYEINPCEAERMKKQYQQFSVEESLFEHSMMFKDFKKLGDLAKKHDAKIYMCTEHTLVDCYPKIKDYKRLFQKQ